MPKPVAELLFARYAPVDLEPKNSIGAKWPRLLDALDLKTIAGGRRTAVKLHLGGGNGFSTVHPFFVRTLVQKLKDAGAKEVFACDVPWNVRQAAARGYTAETIGCPLVSVAGTADKYFYSRPLKPAFQTLKEIQVAGEIADAETLVDLSHVKGHGTCGFGGASKNLSMGCVTTVTRKAIHELEGGIEWNAELCSRCRACLENCPNGAISIEEDNKVEIFFHHCKFCQHCILICPKRALKHVGGGYKPFQHGMALATHQVLSAFQPEHVLYINMLMNITAYCDCWGMTTPALVPDIGILAGRDLVAIEQASLDLIRAQDLIPGSLPKGWKRRGKGHLFAQIHSKDPYVVIEFLEKLGHGSRKYGLREVP